jgi:hypothetical protein
LVSVGLVERGMILFDASWSATVLGASLEVGAAIGVILRGEFG